MCTRKIGNKSCMARTHTRSTLIINLMRIELLFDFDLWPSRALRFIYLYFYINFYSVRFMFIFVPEPFVWRWREIEKSTDFLIQVSNLNRLDCADTKTGPFDKRALWILCLWAVLVAFATQKKPLTSPSCYMYLIRDTWSQFNRRVFCVLYSLAVFCCVAFMWDRVCAFVHWLQSSTYIVYVYIDR